MHQLKNNYSFNRENDIVKTINAVIDKCTRFKIVLCKDNSADSTLGGEYTHTEKIYESPSDTMCKYLLSSLCDACRGHAKCDNKTSKEELEAVKDIKGNTCFLCVSWK